MDLGPHTHRYNSYKPCEDNLADHGSHLRARVFRAFPDKQSSLSRMRPTQHWFQSISAASAENTRPVFTALFASRTLIAPAICHRTALRRNDVDVHSMHSIPIVYCLFPTPCPLFLFPIPYSLPLCYNRRAVENAAKQEFTQVQSGPVQAAAQSVAPSQGGRDSATRTEDPSRYCPVCSQRLESRRCKLICSVCGYYMSCADYY